MCNAVWKRLDRQQADASTNLRQQERVNRYGLRVSVPVIELLTGHERRLSRARHLDFRSPVVRFLTAGQVSDRQ